MKNRILFIYNCYFRPKKIKEELKVRKGKCKNCGECCRHVFSLNLKCPFLKGNNCVLHKWKKYIPIISTCEWAPIKEQWPSRNWKGCGYHWDDD